MIHMRTALKFMNLRTSTSHNCNRWHQEIKKMQWRVLEIAKT